MFPHFTFETEQWKNGFSVLGIDEAGRGAFAGPLAVGGVVFDHNFADYISGLGINDSKLLSLPRRETLYDEIKKNALFSHVELVPLAIIEKLGIGKATTYGMQEVYRHAVMTHRNIFALIDAFEIPGVKAQKGIIKGDRTSISIAAASILAKVTRDQYMDRLAMEHSGYEWEKNKGYGTLKHRQAIQKLGMTAAHRTVFCRKLFVQENVI